MSAAKIRKGDKVVVLSGKDKGKTGEVVTSMPKDGKVVVSGVNVATRHTQADPGEPAGRPRAQRSADARLQGRDRRPQGRQGDARPLRDGKDGKKVRVAAKSGEKIDG